MLCFDLMEMVGEQVEITRQTIENKGKYELVLKNIKNRSGDFKKVNLWLLAGWWQ